MVFTRNSVKASQSSQSLISSDTSGYSRDISGATDKLDNSPERPALHVSSKCSESLTRSQTLEELERELFHSSDSSDAEDFSFKNKTKQKDSTSSDAEVSSVFVIDRAANNEVVSDPPQTTTTVKRTQNDTKIDERLLVEELSTAPTSIQVPDVKTADNLTLLESTNKSAQFEIMKKAVVSTGFEKRHAIPTYSEGKKAMARKRREELASTKTGWFDMKAPEMTEELEADLQAVQMRGSTASWTGYKKNDYKNGPKFFQIATVQDSPIDFYHSRIVKKDRKRTIVDELLADAEFRKNNKKMYVKAVEKLNKRHPNKKGGRHAGKSKR